MKWSLSFHLCSESGGASLRLLVWIARASLWGLAFLAMAALGLWLFLQSDFAQETARSFLVNRLERLLGREIRVEAVTVDLFPPTLEVRELVIGGSGPEDPPFAVIPLARVQAEILVWWRPAVALRLLEVEAPEIYLEFREDGTDNLPRIRRLDGGRRRVEVEIGTLLLEQGILRVNEERLPFTLKARSVWARFLGEGENQLRGQVRAKEAEVTLPHGRPYPAAVEVEGTYRPGEIRFFASRISGPELAADVAGSFVWNGEKELRVEVSAQGSGELLAHLGYGEDQVQGPLELRGTFGWRQEGWAYGGQLRSPGLRLLGRRVRGLSGRLAGDRSGLRLDIEQASYAGGSVTGWMTVDALDRDHPIELDLQFADLALEPLLQDQGIPVEGLAGRAYGSFNYRFPARLPREGDGWAEVQIRQVVRGGRRLPVQGSAPLVIQGGVLGSEAIQIISPRSRLIAQGQYDFAAQEGRFGYEISTTGVGELALLLELATGDEESPPWLPTHGAGTLRGSLRLSPPGPEIDLELGLVEVASSGLRADRLQGSLRIYPWAVEGLRLELGRNGGALMVTGEVPLPGGRGAAKSLDLAVDAVAWPVEDVGVWLPFALPVSGTFSGRIHLEGSLEEMSGGVELAAAPARAFNLGFDRLETRLRWDEAELLVEELLLWTPAGGMSSQGRVDLADQRLDFTVEGAGLALDASPFSDLLGGELIGNLSLSGEIGGTLDRPEVVARAEARELALGDRALGRGGRAEARVHVAGGALEAQGSLLGLITFDGGGQLSRQEVDLSFHLSSSELEGLLEILMDEPPRPVTGGFDGTLQVTGLPSSWEDLAVDLRLDGVTIQYQGHSLANLEPVAARVREGTLEIQSLFLGEAGSESELFLAGRIGLEENPSLDLRLQGTLAAAWFEPLLPGTRMRGSLDFLGTVRGTARKPAANGQGEIREGQLIFAAFPHAFEDVRGTLLFSPREVVVDQIQARLGGGTVRATGRLELFQAEREGAYTLHLLAQRVTLRYPEGWLLRGNADATVLATADGRMIRGVLDLDRAYYLQDVPVGLTQLLERLLARQRIEVGETDELLASTQLSVLVRAPGTLRVRNNVADLRGTAELTLRGNLARPVVFGQVEVEPGGSLLYADNRYLVERGLLTFANPLRIEPVLDLVATTDVRNYDITLNLSGTLERLNASFSSEPPLSNLEVLALITTGQAPAGEGRAGAETALGATAFLYGQAASVISQRVNTLFGFDKFRIDPLATASGDISSLRFTVGKQISKDLFVTYSRAPTSTEEEIIQAEWQVTHNLILIFTQSGDGSFAVDTRWETKF